jgi:putative transposase
MPRIARVVIPGCPHHVIQRGSRRLNVFFSDNDKVLYLNLLARHIANNAIRIWAYCLMENHIHLVAVPPKPDSFSRAIGEAHRAYATTINIREDWKGHLWQARFLSCPMDEKHAYAAIRYVELNPVRAGIVDRAEEYRWSSAPAHIFGTSDPLLSQITSYVFIKDWGLFLDQGDLKSEARDISNHTQTGRPLGDATFIKKLEAETGRCLAPKVKGRKKWGNGILSPI